MNHVALAEPSVDARATSLFHEYLTANYSRTSRMFAGLFVGQWIFGILLAVLWSPYAWEGKTQVVHVHVYAAIFLGAALCSLPLVLIATHPAAATTRFVVACAQMLWSALLIHLSGGRIETHFHVFGSLAFLAFYRDWRVLVPATVLVASDHFVRGLFWPESVYGILNPEWWRFFEHAFWVVFEDIILILACLRGVEEIRMLAARQAEAEVSSEREREKSAALKRAMAELNMSHETLARTEKLAAVGQLAASVGHELRNPLAAVRNAHTYISKKVHAANQELKDQRLSQFMGIVDRELSTCNKIISDLLDFARERRPSLRPTPLRPLVDEAISLVLRRPDVQIANAVPTSLPIPSLDQDQFRQVLINLLQNAVEAMPSERPGQVEVSAEGGEAAPWRIRVKDNGAGIPEDVVPRIFQPLFSTKNKGTGLGLAVVSSMVHQHGGTIRVDSKVGEGTEFLIELPGDNAPAAPEAAVTSHPTANATVTQGVTP